MGWSVEERMMKTTADLGVASPLSDQLRFDGHSLHLRRPSRGGFRHGVQMALVVVQILRHGFGYFPNRKQSLQESCVFRNVFRQEVTVSDYDRQLVDEFVSQYAIGLIFS